MDVTELRARARRHLGPHFTRKDTWDSDFPVFVRGEGSYLIDTEGDRFLDGLAGLFCVNIGHGRDDIAKAASEQIDAGVCLQLGQRPHSRDRGVRAHRRPGAR